MYIGFTATGEVLAGKALAHLTQVSNTTGILIYACFIIVLQRLAIGDSLGRKSRKHYRFNCFVYYSYSNFALSNFSELLAVRHFSWSSFLLAFLFRLLGKFHSGLMLQTTRVIYQQKPLQLGYFGQLVLAL